MDIENNNITSNLIYRNDIPIGKRKILLAAIDLFYKQGFDRTSTVQISKEAGVSEGVIYKHFKSKQGLLDAIINPVFTDLSLHINNSLISKDKYTEKDIREIIAATIKEKMVYLYNNKKIIKIMLIELMNNTDLCNRMKTNFSINYPTIINSFHSIFKNKHISNEEVLRLIMGSLFYEFFKMVFYDDYNSTKLKNETENIINSIFTYVD
ncbi:TetR/AcrR family transcriptional regulator [Latilactobacillus curvatus]|uniref:TetR/AcrR family transcriptional regulator n=1 Tax=Latilactobacillus curvatus TaxID=28038 RepID=UPI0039B09E0D